MAKTTNESSSSSKASVDASATFGSMWSQVVVEYQKDITPKLMLIDALVVLSVLTGLSQIVYMLLVGSFPFNSFLSGLLACMGTYAFAVSLRLRITSSEFADVSAQQAFGEFSFCFLTLFFIVTCFLG
jgi:oligosaccharyltransferase complex subunit epsilon